VFQPSKAKLARTSDPVLPSTVTVTPGEYEFASTGTVPPVAPFPLYATVSGSAGRTKPVTSNRLNMNSFSSGVIGLASHSVGNTAPFDPENGLECMSRYCRRPHCWAGAVPTGVSKENCSTEGGLLTVSHDCVGATTPSWSLRSPAISEIWPCVTDAFTVFSHCASRWPPGNVVFTNPVWLANGSCSTFHSAVPENGAWLYRNRYSSCAAMMRPPAFT
jgi:hypothetical protein